MGGNYHRSDTSEYPVKAKLQCPSLAQIMIHLMLFMASTEWIGAILKADTQGAVIDKSLMQKGKYLMGERLSVSTNSTCQLQIPMVISSIIFIALGK